ncbi:hypothetical protein DITRI_Ditri17bG0049700 [Diplodiscus trichospermus]
MTVVGGKICGISNLNVLLHGEQLSCSSEVMESLWIPSSSSALQGQKPIIDCENVNGVDTRDMPFFKQLENDQENGDDAFDLSCQPPGKKRRLTVAQLQFLERSFEVENKLEAERKVQLAKELGLEPRQVAIWFQNRRARYKNKQLVKDYDSLKASYDKLKADCDNLLKEKHDMKKEVLALRKKLLLTEKEAEILEYVEAINLNNVQPLKPSSDTSPGDVSHVPLLACEREEACSAKSDAFDSDDPQYADGNQPSLIEPVDSSNAFEPNQSDFSQDEDDNLSKSLLHSSVFLPKFEFDCFYGAPAHSLLEEDQSFWSSLY